MAIAAPEAELMKLVNYRFILLMPLVDPIECPGRFHITVNAAGAYGCGGLVVERLLEVVFVVSGA
jgi:hypothetical protein